MWGPWELRVFSKVVRCTRPVRARKLIAGRYLTEGPGPHPALSTHAKKPPEAGERRLRDPLRAACCELRSPMVVKDRSQIDEASRTPQARDLPCLRQTVKIQHVVLEVERRDVDVEHANGLVRSF